MEKPIICVDFDGVIASWEHGTFTKPGPPIAGAGWFLEELSKIGRVVICTCRTNSELYDGQSVMDLVLGVHGWLVHWGLSEFVYDIYHDQGKPYAACYIDDKAIHCDPESRQDDCSFESSLAKAKAMCQNGKQCPSKGK